MVQLFLRARVGFVAFALSIGAVGRAATAEQMLGDVNRLLPDAKASLLPAASVAPGRYARDGSGPFGVSELYLFPDGTFALKTPYRNDFSHTTFFHEGKWSVSDGFLKLAYPDPGEVERHLPGAWPAGTVDLFLPAKMMYNGKMESVLLRHVRWDEIVKTHEATAGNGMRFGSEVVALLSNPGGFRDGEVAALKREFDEDYGRHSLRWMTARFRAGYLDDEATKRSDGSFLIESAPFAELTIDGVNLRARRIEINRELDVVRLVGSVEVMGRKLPTAPGVRIFIEGKEMPPGAQYGEAFFAVPGWVAAGAARLGNAELAQIRTSFEPGGELTPAEVRIVVTLAVASGLPDVGEISVSKSVWGTYDILAKSREIVAGREISWKQVSILSDRFRNEKRRGEVLTDGGLLWVSTWTPPSTAKVASFVVNGKSIRMYTGSKVALPTADKIVEALATKRFLYADESVKKKLEAVPANQADLAAPVAISVLQMDPGVFGVGFNLSSGSGLTLHCVISGDVVTVTSASIWQQ